MYTNYSLGFILGIDVTISTHDVMNFGVISTFDDDTYCDVIATIACHLLFMSMNRKVVKRVILIIMR